MEPVPDLPGAEIVCFGGARSPDPKSISDPDTYLAADPKLL
jgi:hypothetical protein